VALETRPPSVEGSGAIDVRSLLRAALRMRPDRIVVGEVRGGEALDMLQAMNTGHRGSLTTAHANGSYHALLRVEATARARAIDPRAQARRRECRLALPGLVEAVGAALASGLSIQLALAEVASTLPSVLARATEHAAAALVLGARLEIAFAAFAEVVPQ